MAINIFNHAVESMIFIKFTLSSLNIFRSD